VENNTVSKKLKVLVGVPSWGWAPPECNDYRVMLMAHLTRWQANADCPYEFHYSQVTDQLVSVSRETICLNAIWGDYDYVGMIDDDMLGRVNEYDLWDRMLKHDVDIIAPLMFMRQHPHNPVVYAIKGGRDERGVRREYGTYFIRNYPKEQLFECDALGFGAVLIKVELLKRMQQPWFYVTNMDRKGDTGEDVYFCVEAGKKGARIFCDSSIHLLHLGPRKYVGEKEYELAQPDVVEMRRTLGEWNRTKQKQNLIA